MKAVATLSLAAAFAIGLVASAQAWQLPTTAYEDQLRAPASAFSATTDWHAPSCVGFHSGTAHAACGGTATGGPVGGLN